MNNNENIVEIANTELIGDDEVEIEGVSIIDTPETCQATEVEVIESKFFDDLESWLKFNERVVYEGGRLSNPILERLNFIGIADSNLDEFIRTKFNKRRGNTKLLKKLIQEQTNFIESQYCLLLEELREKHSINITTISNITDKKAYKDLKNYFKNNIYPILQPLVMTEELPMPNLSDGATFLITKFDDGKTCIVRVPDTELIKVKIKSENAYKQTYVPIEDVIEEFVYMLYRGKKIENNYMIRALRRIDSLTASHDNYLNYIKQQIKNREVATIQMIDYCGSYSGLKGLITNKESKRKRQYVYGLSYLKNIKDFISYTDDMIYPKARPRTPVELAGESMFDILSEKDVLVHFPYESFDMSTIRLLEEAANDPNVLSIKQTLYRVGQDSPLITALINAAKKGKQVIVLLELKAKMDEENNLKLTNKLKDAGCSVIFGPINIKTHAKVTLVIRKEHGEIAKYINVSTGNFNDKTAKIYEDLSYFVKEKRKLRIGNDLIDLFNYLGGYSKLSEFNDLLISPETFRPKIENQIDKCIECKKNFPDQDVSINMKCNAFTDKRIAEKLYDAANNGVKVFLIIRGMCIVKPKENLNIISVVGRYLEHSRIYEFNYCDKDGKKIVNQYIGSGDMMPRNLDYRVEVIIPIKTKHVKKMISEIINQYKLDNTNAYILCEDGNYKHPDETIPVENRITTQEVFISKYKELEEKELIK